MCPPWAQWLSPQLSWHSLGHRTPLFFGYHSVTQKLLQSCAQSLKTGCLTISPGIAQTAGHSALPPARFTISALLPSPSSPFHSSNPRESSSSPTENFPQNLFYQILSVSQIFWVLSRAQILETKAPTSSFSLIFVISLPLGNDSRGLNQVRQYRKRRE